jgi:beta-glucuronidase
MANEMLYPRNTLTRKVISLDGMWKFKFDPESNGLEEQWEKGLQNAIQIPVPSSFNDLFTDKESREYAGDFWYETEFFVPSEWKNEDFNIRFGCATHKATVYVNGVEVTSHIGGFLPFNASINEIVHFDENNLIVVQMNNELSVTTLPVGKTEVLRNGKKMVKPFFDFFNYAGLQRSVSLVVTPKESIVDFTVNHLLEGQDARVEYEVKTTGSNDVWIEVYDEKEELVATQSGKSNTIFIQNAKLWRPLNAYLYTFRILIKNGEDILDEYNEEIGIRTVHVEGNKLYINDEEVYLKGFGKHMDFDVVGRGFDPVVMKRDFELLKWSGANSFRTAHYPYDEQYYQMADREGIIIIDEVAAVGLLESTKNFLDAAGGKITGFFNRDIVHEETKVHHKNDIRELIQRDKNYACVCIWSLLNEPDTEHESVVPYVKAVFEKAHQLDEQKRPRTLLLSMSSTPETSKIHDLCDIVSLNRFYGWDVFGGYELSDAEEEMEEEMASWAKVEKPILFTAYGAESIPGEFKLPSVQWSENYQVEVLRMQHRIFDRYAFIRGEQVWSFSDYQTPENLTAIDGNKSGIFTRNRQPKVAAYLIKDRWDNIPLNFKC